MSKQLERPAPAPSDPIPPPRFVSRWTPTGRLQVDDLDRGERQTWKRNDDGFYLIHVQPLTEEPYGPLDL